MSVPFKVRKYEKERIANDSTYWLIFELLWRDFFRYSAVKNGNSIFHLGGPRHDSARQVWRNDVGLLEAWKAGETGYPFIDANMRELKASGFMSNRYGYNRDVGIAAKHWRMGPCLPRWGGFVYPFSRCTSVIHISRPE